MNIFYKFYCRAFQTGFKLAIPILPYREPKVFDNTRTFVQKFHSEGITRVLVVTDEFIAGSRLMEELKDALDKSGMEYVVYSKTVPNPTCANVHQAAELYRAHGAQGIIALGGGSSMDCAKIVGAVIAKPKKSIGKMKGILRILKKTPPLAAIPTTAGTGSEVTVAAIITDEKTHHKFPISDFCLIPDYAVLDAKLTVSLPQKLTATTGMDALTHAVEAYIGRSTTKKTRKQSEQAVKLVFDNILTAYNEPENMTARENMLKAAYLAGCAFTVSYVGYCHGAAHALGGKYNTPHGLANAVLLVPTLEMYGECVHKKIKRLAVAAGLCGNDVSDEQAFKMFNSKILQLNSSMSIPKTLPEIKEQDLEELCKHASKESNPLYPVPKLYNAKGLEKLYRSVMEE